MSKTQTPHRGRAAGHQESSTRHHRAAELEYGSGDHKKAALEAMNSHSNGKHASHHDEIVADEMVAHHGMDPVVPPADEAVDATKDTPYATAASATTSDATGDSGDPHDAKVAIAPIPNVKSRRRRAPRPPQPE